MDYKHNHREILGAIFKNDPSLKKALSQSNWKSKVLEVVAEFTKEPQKLVDGWKKSRS